jgi:hypothetical protein
MGCYRKSDPLAIAALIVNLFREHFSNIPLIRGNKELHVNETTNCQAGRPFQQKRFAMHISFKFALLHDRMK